MLKIEVSSVGLMWPLILIGNPSLNRAWQGLLVKVDEPTHYNYL